MVRGPLKFAGLVLFACLLLAGGEAGISVAGPANSKAAPGDLLSDGYDALGADRPDLARKIFQTLLHAYPQSNEAATAADELAAIDGDDALRAEEAARAGAQEPPAPAAVAAPAVRPQKAPRNDVASNPGDQLRKARLHFLTDVGDRVFFAENSDTLGGRARSIVEAQARWLKKASHLEVTIIGRAADGGSASDNAALSLARARAVEARLIEAGVEATRIRVEGRGNTDPIATCPSAMCEAQNRHVESYLRFAGSEGAQAAPPRSGALAREGVDARSSTITAR